jgi:glycosyltransferase involved in cell wall biosynthesis
MTADRFVIWTNMPNHYQSAFHAALRAQGADLVVRYYASVRPDRVAMGWAEVPALGQNEGFAQKCPTGLETVPDWRDRVHVVPGCREPFLRWLARRLSIEDVPWVHWSEPSHPGWRRLAGWPQKRWYGGLINRHALGALAKGRYAANDFRAWGVRPEKIAIVPYSSMVYPHEGASDEVIERFAEDARPVFGFVGALCPRKGTDVLLRAFAESVGAATSGRTVLILVGPDRSDGAYDRLTRSLGLAENVCFRGAVAPCDMDRVMRRMDVLCLPSRFDGWGVVLNEGASLGLALIASEAAGAGLHLISEGLNGFRAVTGSVRSLSSAMGAYINDPSLAQAHGERSRLLFDDYTPERNAERFLSAVRTFWALQSWQ